MAIKLTKKTAPKTKAMKTKLVLIIKRWGDNLSVRKVIPPKKCEIAEITCTVPYL